MSVANMVELRTPLQAEMVSMVVGCAENTAKSFGFGKEECLCLSLAIEEVFVFLCAQSQEPESFQLLCRNGFYYIEAACFFSSHVLPTKVFNMTASLELEDEAALAELGLLLAARSVDKFRLTREKDGGMGLYLTVEKRYPQANAGTVALLSDSGFYLAEPGPEEIKQFAKAADVLYESEAPAFCRFPGKVVDMMKSGEYGIAIAKDGKGNVGGAFLWRYNGRMAECYGPYIFSPQAKLAEAIVENAVGKLARHNVLGMFVRQPTRQMPDGYFEELGEYKLKAPDGKVTVHRALFRQMEEDNGLSVFAHPQIEGFVRETYSHLALPRQIRLTMNEGEAGLPNSVLASQVFRRLKTATLSISVAGEDTRENLAMHAAVLRQEGMINIFLELDLGDAEEVNLVPAILAAGFVPQLIVPWGGKGDLAVFWHVGEE